MISRRFFFGLAVFVFLASLSSAAGIIVVNDSSLVFIGQQEKAYSLKDVLVSGDLKTNALDVSGEGEVIAGEDVKVYLFGPAEDFLVKDVKVDGQETTVSFDNEGYYFIVHDGEFSFTGKLMVRAIGQTRLKVRGPMNQLRFNMQNGYAVDGDRFGLINSTILLQRAQESAMLVDGSFRFTYAERDEFMYQITFKSFGETLGTHTLELLNGEQISSVTGAVKWEQQAGRLVLELEGNSASVVVRGVFSSNSLRVPLESDRHHVLVESDPEKKITVSTSAQEIDVSQSAVRPQYSNARAFIASNKEVIYVTVKKLDLLPSLAAAVRYATNTIAVTEKGSVLGELNYNYANTGVDYIEVDAPGDPLYASTAQAPVKLTAEGKLLLALPKTQQGSLDVVYFTTRGKIKPVDLIKVPLATTDMPISRAQTRVYLPKDYYLIETFGAKGGSELPSAETVIIYAILASALAAAIFPDKKFVVYYLIASTGIIAFSGRLFLLLIALSLGLIAKKTLSKKTGTILGGVGAVITLIILIALSFMVIWQLGVFNIGSPMSSVSREYGADYAVMESAASAPMMKGLNLIGDKEDEGSITVPVRTGVYPVKLDIPSLGKSISVTNYLVTKENPVEISVLVVSSYFKYLLYALSFVACVRAYRLYSEKNQGRKN